MRTISLLLIGCALLGCAIRKPEPIPPAGAFIDRYMKNVTQLTFEGDNGEAYFSWNSKKLIFQSSRGGYACDKIWTMNIYGSDKRMVSPNHGANTCSFFFP